MQKFARRVTLLVFNIVIAGLLALIIKLIFTFSKLIYELEWLYLFEITIISFVIYMSLFYTCMRLGYITREEIFNMRRQ